LSHGLDPIFRADSYGYRPGKSGAGGNCRYQTPLLGLRLGRPSSTIRGLFDNLDHGLLMKALRKHCQEPWILLYVERWLKRRQCRPRNGQILERDKGTPQGGGRGSPILANLFLCTMRSDLWVARHLPGVRYARYADDAVLPLQRADRQAEYVLDRVRERFQACKLELHPGKTRIVYCQDINRTEDHPDVQFTFLGILSDRARQWTSMAGFT